MQAPPRVDVLDVDRTDNDWNLSALHMAVLEQSCGALVSLCARMDAAGCARKTLAISAGAATALAAALAQAEDSSATAGGIAAPADAADRASCRRWPPG